MCIITYLFSSSPFRFLFSTKAEEMEFMCLALWSCYLISSSDQVHAGLFVFVVVLFCFEKAGTGGRGMERKTAEIIAEKQAAFIGIRNALQYLYFELQKMRCFDIVQVRLCWGRCLRYHKFDFSDEIIILNFLRLCV